MDISIDLETLGLRATKDSFIMGCLWIENRKKHEVYYSPKKLWKRVLELAKQCEREKRTLTVWSHNAQYDTAGYVNLKDRQLRFLSNKPFIWNYINGEGKEIIRFLDTMNIFPKMSLKKVGEIIGIPKMDYDVSKIRKDMNKEELEEMEKYCANDTLIVLKAVRYIKDKLKEEDIEMRRIITINQIARNYLWNKWLKLGDEYLEPYFWNKKKGETRRTFRKNEIHSAYRGGRCEAFQYGKIKEAKEADCNCYDKETRILTKSGLKYYNELNENDYVLTMNKNEELEYNKINKIFKRQYNGEMHQFINENTDLLVTPNHRILYYGRKGKYCSGIKKNLIIKEAKDVPLTYIKIPNARKYKEGKVEINKNLIKILSWIITEGNYVPSSDAIIIYQSSQRNNEYANEIEKSLKSLNINYRKKGRNKCVNHDMCWEFYINAKDGKWLREICPNKIIEQEWMLNWNLKSLEILFWTLMKGDGSFRYQKKATFVAKDELMRLRFQELAMKTGRKTKNCNKNKVVYIKMNRDGNSLISSVGKRGRKEFETNRIKNYSGVVWCVSVENMNVVVERNGKMSICGNSLYPYALTQIKTPNLKTERKRIYTEKQHNERAYEYIDKDMDKIGIARVMLKNDTCELGLLQTRTDEGNYYPRIGQTIIGTYTNIEIKKALEEGYSLIDVEWSILYDEAINPFKEIIPEIYKKRQTPSPFDSWFYKMMMNAGIGKMAQHRTEQDIKIKSIEKAKEMLNEGYEIIGSEDEEDYFYKKIDVKAKAKPYYLPIIPTLVNAWSRIYMYNALKGAKGLIYTDTDSVIAKELPKDVKYGYDLGKFKTVRENEEMYIYGRKTYKIGNEIRLSGIGKSMLKTEEFDKGEINYKKQITIATTNNLKLVGEFKEEKRNLNLQTINEQNKKEELKSKELIIDSDIKDINKFMETLIKTM